MSCIGYSVVFKVLRYLKSIMNMNLLKYGGDLDMKKFFYSFFVAVATMFAETSCSQEEVVVNEASADEVEVTFNATMKGQAVSRAIGDGLTVDQLLFAVYDENGEEITNLRQNDVAVSNLGATVNVRLVKGQTYQFVFWAQKSGAGHYDTSNMKAISVDYNNISNDESRDAFYTFVGKTKVTGPFSQDVTLKRPFAQLNLGTTAQDWGWAQTAGVTITDSKVKVTGEVYSTLNTFDGTVAGETPVEFTLNAIPSQGDLLVTDNKSYYYLSTNYLLAPADKSLSEEIVFTLNAGANPINELKVYNAPLQRNWRTNIVGEILTGEGTFNITVDPIFDGDRNYDMPGSELEISDFMLKDSYAEVGSPEALLKWAYMAGKTNKSLGLKLVANIEMPAFTIAEENGTYVFTNEPITVTEGIPSGSNWISLCEYETAGNAFYNGIVDGQNFTISGLRIKANTVAAGFIGWMDKGATVKNVTFNNAVVYNAGGSAGETYTGTAVGRACNGTLIENVHVTNSSVLGKSEVGGIVGRNYRRKGGSNNYNEQLAYVKHCTTDEHTTVTGTASMVGGICGRNYGAVLYHCVNHADVNGTSHVGGVVGYSRDYWKNVDGYVVACGSSENATITATNGNAGGIVGYTFKDNNHDNTVSWIVACYSLSEISAKNAGTMLGALTNGTITASWALMNGTANYAGSSQNSLIRQASEHYASATEITAADVDAMNQAIAAFNANNLDNIQCEYSWSMTSNWPELN